MKQLKNMFKSPNKSNKPVCQTCGKILERVDQSYCESHLNVKEESDYVSLKSDMSINSQNNKTGGSKLKSSGNHSASNYPTTVSNTSNNNVNREVEGNPFLTIILRDELDKVTQLQSMFENLNEDVIRICLRDNNNDIDRSIDTLLNLTALLPQSSNASTTSSSAATANNTDNHSSSTPSLSNNNPSSTSGNIGNNSKKVENDYVDNMQLTNIGGNDNIRVSSEINIENKSKINNNKENSSNSNNIEKEIVNGVESGNLKKVEYYLKLIKENIVEKDKYNEILDNCLLIGIQNGNNNMINLLIEYGANVNGNKKQIYTPLLLSIELRQIDTTILLLNKYKVDVNFTTTNISNLHLAIKYNDIKIVELLIYYGHNINAIEIETGKSCLYISFQLKHFEILKLLLSKNVNIRIKEKEYLETVVHLAIRSSLNSHDLLISNILLDYCKNNNFNDVIDDVDKYGNTILHIAVQRSSSQQSSSTLLDLILPYNPNPFIKNKSSLTPLDLLANSQNVVVINKLKEYCDKYQLKQQSSNTILPVHKPITGGNGISAPIQPNITSHYSSISATPIQKNIVEVQEPIDVPDQQLDSDYLLVKQFSEHTDKMLNDDWEVSVEFSEIENSTADANLIGDFTSALQPYNIFKNRYRNILPYEQTRVQLHSIEGNLGSDFISANWISGETQGTEHAYIATQGPLQHTVNDFWRMVWDYKIDVVIMLSNLLENGRVKLFVFLKYLQKCKEKVWQYWPEGDTTMDLNDFIIQLQNFKQTDQIINRIIKISKKTKIDSELVESEVEYSEERSIHHIQYIGWPDHGLPDDNKGFAKILDLVETFNTNQSPIVVHCSAGIGRTGTFCLAHSNWLKLKLLSWSSVNEPFDLKQGVLRMREQRAGMIQTKDQYVYCYISLKEKITVFLELITYKNQKWFHKTVNNKESAIKLLLDKKVGSFLVYPSPQPATVNIAVKNAREIQVSTIKIDEKSGFIHENGAYPTLLKLLGENRSIFKSPVLRS